MSEQRRQQIIVIPNGEFRELRASESTQIKLLGGQSTGQFSIERFLNPARPDARKPLLMTQFEFKARGGRCYRHKALVHPAHLFPREHLAAAWSAPHSFTPGLEISLTLDSREGYCITVDGSTRLAGFLKRVDSEFAIMLDKSGVRIRNRFYCGDQLDQPNAGSGFCTIYYVLPYTYFLWRRWSKFYVDDLLPEGEPYVYLEEIESISLPESAIEVQPQTPAIL